MSRFMTVYQRNENLKKIVVILMTGLSAAVALNYFLIPANVFSAGMNGIAQIIASLLSEWVHIDVDTGTFIFLLNIPVFILGFLKVGKRATVLSFINVVCVSVMTTVLPTGQVTDNILMNALVGGVFTWRRRRYFSENGFYDWWNGHHFIGPFSNDRENRRKLYADFKWHYRRSSWLPL